MTSLAIPSPMAAAVRYIQNVSVRATSCLTDMRSTLLNSEERDHICRTIIGKSVYS